MRVPRILLPLLLLLCAIPAIAQNYTTVISTNIQGLKAGSVLASGSIYFTITDQNDVPISVHIGGGGITLNRPYQYAVTNGAIEASATVPNAQNTSPSGVYYRIQAYDGATSELVLDLRRVQITGTTFDIDNYIPSALTVPPPATGSATGPVNVAGDVSATGTITAGNVSFPGVAKTTTANAFTQPQTITDARFKGNPWFDVKANGAVGDGTTDDSAAFVATCGSVNAAGVLARAMFIPSGTYKVVVPSGGILCAFTQRGIAINGAGKEITGGSVINANFNTSTGGALFQWGADDGLPWDSGASLYQGIQGANVSNLYINCFSAATALLNGQGNYCPNAYAIRDWRGGSQVLMNVVLAHFDYGFWGINSDFDIFQNVWPLYNHTAGIYLGPRSDQAILQVNSLFNDTALRCEKCWNLDSSGSHWVGDGSATTYPIEIHEFAVDHAVAKSEQFHHDWFEHFQGANTIPGFINVGVGDTNQSLGIEIENPVFMSNALGTTFHAQALVAVGNADNIHVLNPTPYANNVIDYLFDFWGNSSPTDVLVDRSSSFAGIPLANYSNSTGAPHPIGIQRGGLADKIISASDAAFERDIDCGRTASQTCAMNLRDRGVNIIGLQKPATNGFQVWDFVNAFNRFGVETVPNGKDTLASIGTGGVEINTTNGSGIGGFKVGSGGAVASTVATIDSTGKITANGGAQIGASGSTINADYKGSATLTYTAITAPGCQEQPLTVTGAAAGDKCDASTGASDIGSTYYYGGCRVSAANTAQVKVCATATGTPSAVTWTGWARH